MIVLSVLENLSGCERERERERESERERERREREIDREIDRGAIAIDGKTCSLNLSKVRKPMILYH